VRALIVAKGAARRHRAQLSVTTGIALTNSGFYLGVKNARLTACRTYPWPALGGGYLNGWATFV